MQESNSRTCVSLEGSPNERIGSNSSESSSTGSRGVGGISNGEV